jgi:hypothetical protein
MSITSKQCKYQALEWIAEAQCQEDTNMRKRPQRINTL